MNLEGLRIDRWEMLKEYLELVINEAYEKGYDIDENDLNRGHFLAYRKVMDEIRMIEKYDKINEKIVEKGKRK